MQKGVRSQPLVMLCVMGQSARGSREPFPHFTTPTRVTFVHHLVEISCRKRRGLLPKSCHPFSFNTQGLSTSQNNLLLVHGDTPPARSNANKNSSPSKTYLVQGNIRQPAKQHLSLFLLSSRLKNETEVGKQGDGGIGGGVMISRVRARALDVKARASRSNGARRRESPFGEGHWRIIARI